MAQSIEDARRRQQGASASRVPPHNLQAEESLLGAMLLSRDAIVAAVQEQAGVTLERKRVHLEEPIKALGTHEVPVRLHPEVEFRLPVEVVPA